MIANYSQSRAAILCFGGWGLQVMLHLAPRLQAAQEQRAALDTSGGFPDLNRIVRYGAVLPEPLLDGSGQARFHLHTLRMGEAGTGALPPFYVERTLARAPEAGPGSSRRSLLTAAERRAAWLLEATAEALAPLTFGDAPGSHVFSAPGTGLASLGTAGSPAEPGTRRATRLDLFHAALAHADTVARLLEIHLFDPIRQDRLAPDDPFVQTTLYVVAPLFEPLVPALIWPLVAQTLARLGRRHITQVVALFATGSYADDVTRQMEDASCYAALRELELLTGLAADDQAQAALAELARRAPGVAAASLAREVGCPLFDHIYLLDREKSNQGLAQDSHELAILAGNALEAFITGSGDLYVQEQTNFFPHGAEPRAGAAQWRPYSLLGAAGDYVPLQAVFHAVNRQEESRLVREWVLRNTPDDEPAPPRGSLAARLVAAQSWPTLADLGFSPARALAQLPLRLPDLFAHPEPKDLAHLQASQSFILPPAAAERLRRVPGFPASRWIQAFETHLDEVRAYVELAAGPAAIDEAWGLDVVPATEGVDQEAHAPGWFSDVLESDDRLFPRTLTRMQQRLLDLLAASPTGLPRARQQTRRWLQECEETLHQLEVASTPSTRQLTQVRQRLALQEWQVRYRRVVERLPSLGGVLARAGLATLAVGLLAWGYLWLVQRPWQPMEDGLALLGFGLGALLAGVSTYRFGISRRSRLRRARVALAQAEITARLQEEAHAGLMRAYSRLVRVLRAWEQLLAEAMAELHALSTPPTMPAVPPPEVPTTYLYQPHLNQALWDRCLEYLRSHLDSFGKRSEERLDILWGTAAWRQELRRILRGEAGSAASSSGRGRPGPARTIAGFIRQTVRESVAPVGIQEPNPVRAALIRTLAPHFNLEELLWRQPAEAAARAQREHPGRNGQENGAAGQAFSRRRYLEGLWNRAKPTANYDVVDRLAVHGISVDFAAAWGTSESELSWTLQEEFKVALLPTGNPFTALLVRTVHGLALEDLACMRRYQTELSQLSPEARTLVQLDNSPTSPAYPATSSSSPANGVATPPSREEQQA